ncbi:MAG: hypothetical protein OEZ06_18090 [Myxococcales bacterium]|nr:hypothetical protein [Myxococcales bacterium]
MNTDLANARKGDPWSLSGVIFGLSDARDTEGRPLCERRAPISAKEGVPMKLRPCPYGDERERRTINLSALAQVTAHLETVVVDAERFHGLAGSSPRSWSEVHMLVLDQLAQAALFQLGDPKRRAPIPAPTSVAYKIAVGYSEPVRELLMRELLGQKPEVSAEALLSLVKEERYLVGASEACAGPPHLLRRVTRAFVEGPPRPPEAIEARRLAVARLLGRQVELGICFGLFDRQVEHALFFGSPGTERFAPRTRFLRDKVAERQRQLLEADTPLPRSPLPAGLDAGTAHSLETVMAACFDRTAHVFGNTPIIESLLAHGESAIVIPSEQRASLAQSFAAYLEAHSAFQRALTQLELQLRAQLGPWLTPPSGPDDRGQTAVALNPAIFPLPRALPWFEMIVGHRLHEEAGPDPKRVLRNQHRSVPLHGTAAAASSS